MKPDTKRYLKTTIAAQLFLTILPLALFAEGRREPPPEMKKALETCATKAKITVGSDPRAAMKAATKEQRQTFRECMRENRPEGMRGHGKGGPRHHGDHDGAPPPPPEEDNKSDE